MTFWHDNGAYTPYGIICPIVTSTQLLGPYKPGAYRVEFYSIYTTTVIVTPVPRRRAGRRGCSRWNARWTGSPRRSAWTAPRSARRNFIQPDEFPFDQGLIFQDGRPLIYDSGNYPAQLEMIKDMIGWDDFEPTQAEAATRGPAARHRDRLLRRGHRSRAVRGRARPGADRRQRRGRHRADLAGPGPPDGVRADRRRRTGRAVRVGPGHHRRHPPFRLRGGHVRLPGRGDVRLGGGAGRPRGARRRRCGSPPTRWRLTRTTWRSSTGSSR